MPNIKSAKKRVKVTKVKTERNKAYKSALRTFVKTALTTNTESDAKVALKKLDMAVSKGIIHKNAAARKKSAIVAKVVKA